MDASEIFTKRPNAKEVIFLPKMENSFSSRRWTNKICWRRSGTENIHLDTGSPNSRRRSKRFSWRIRRVSTSTTSTTSRSKHTRFLGVRRLLRFVQVAFLCTFMWSHANGEHAGAARRRRERRLRQFLRHERLSVAMALAEFSHHAAPRGQTLARAGRWVRDALHGRVPEEPTARAGRWVRDALHGRVPEEPLPPRSPTRAQVILISATPMHQNLRIGLRKRRKGKSDVPVKQRRSWPKIS